ncbi:ArnT family glycosyltransferase [Roseivirga thermotolerans]|uniref:Dolichyl-phosphate-mannose--protein mannosyltransferase n=1 Tax=Roseivirga thermotolerans TaxID=1758176 RepID=A0ABQ3I8J9_9BACT|nr:glycosyltransferase family 39 protein [Roseivirga thermotolerans]GHE73477.1 dolichyl-phosphate-mannose--protein mannosyltransferase [Roseivirga thermotolerans]
MKLNIIFACIVALAIAVMYANIGGLDIYALDEAKNAEAARHMFTTGDYVVPYYNGELRTDKPPLHYYFMAAGYSLFGVNPFGARFFSSFFGVLTVILTFLFVLKHFHTRAAIWSALVLITSLHFNLQFHMSVPDPYLIFFTTWAFISFYEAYKTHNRWQLFFFYFAIGCGILTKGPIAIALPGLTALFFLLFNKDFKWKTIWRLQPVGGLLISFMVAFPWYREVHRQTNGAWTEEFFLKHNLSRYSEAMEGHEGIFLITFAYVFLLGMLTFTPFVFQSVKHAIKQRKEEPLLYVLIATLVVVVFFASSSTKLPNYTVPAYPALAVILGVYLSRIDEQWLKNTWNKVGHLMYTIVLLAFPVGIYVGLQADDSLGHLSYLAWYFIPLSLLGVLNVVWLIQKRIYPLLVSNAAGWLITILLFFHLIFPPVDAENPVRKLLPQIDETQMVLSYQRLNPAFVFALEREITRFDNLDGLKEQMKQSPSGYVISRTEFRDELEQIEGLVYHSEARDLFENPTTLIMRWGP